MTAHAHQRLPCSSRPSRSPRRLWRRLRQRPDGAVAVVTAPRSRRRSSTSSIAQAKKGYESQKQEFPKVGNARVPEHPDRSTSHYLVEREEFRQAAEELGVEVTEKDVDEAEEASSRAGSAASAPSTRRRSKAQGFTPEQYRANALETSALSQKLFDEVTKDVKVTDQEILAYYTENQSQYGTPESRDVRHILIAEKDEDGEGRLRGEQGEGRRDLRAARRRRRLRCARQGGLRRIPVARITAASSRSRAVRPFPSSTRSRSSSTRASSRSPSRPSTATTSSRPSRDVRKASTTSLDKVKASIRAQLLQQKRNEEMQAWVEDLRKEYEGKVSYAVGYAPPGASRGADRRHRVASRLDEPRGGAPRPPGTDPAPSPRVPVGSRADASGRSSRTRSRRPTRSPTPRSRTTRPASR